jgi:hypothetical protein
LLWAACLILFFVDVAQVCAIRKLLALLIKEQQINNNLMEQLAALAGSRGL